MQLYKKLSACGRFLTQFIRLQLFLTLFSWPILALWGIPLSLMSFLGNLLFSPLLTVFLLLSTFVFFCELLFIPDSLLLQALEQLTRLWSWVAHRGDSYWLLGTPQIVFWWIALLPALALLCIHSKHLRAKKLDTLALILVTCSTIAFIYYTSSRINTSLSITYGIQKLSGSCHNGQVTLCVPARFRGQRAHFDTWINYTLIPYLIKATGRYTIDKVTVEKPTASARALVQVLHENCIAQELS